MYYEFGLRENVHMLPNKKLHTYSKVENAYTINESTCGEQNGNARCKPRSL